MIQKSFFTIQVSDLYQKLRTLETAVEAICLTDKSSASSKSNSFISEKDLCTILQNLNDLNQVRGCM